jgi:2-polyprenyl-6-hydroxyphenyl methylase/3-demethylubiquinone-9 3-methyltransferase
MEPPVSSLQSGETSAIGLLSGLSLGTVENWFAQFGHTDEGYLRAHFLRYQKTKAFALRAAREGPLSILDVGAHWLHNAYFYARDGHHVHCVDAANTFRVPSVARAAEAMGAVLYPSARLEFGDGISEISESAIDLVLFCEIIEHLAFNPIPLWKQIYRVLKPGGRIIVTTPNANYWPRLKANMECLLSKDGWGVTVNDIMTMGTFGHHWKEYTLNELREYFLKLSDDFGVSSYQFDDIQPQRLAPPSNLPFDFTEDVRHDNIFLEVTLTAKTEGISIEPPWLPQYD